MTDADPEDVLDVFAGAVEGKQCGVKFCSGRPVAERGDRVVCTKHRNHYDYLTMGLECPRCGSTQRVNPPNSTPTCAVCERVFFEEDDDREIRDSEE